LPFRSRPISVDRAAAPEDHPEAETVLCPQGL
jgi:hypothetical protein